MLSSDISPTDPSLSDLTDANDVPNHTQIDEYGYRSDSDLDDDDEALGIPLGNTGPPKDGPGSAMVSTTPARLRVTTQPKDDDE